jgi:hypothetical protein
LWIPLAAPSPISAAWSGELRPPKGWQNSVKVRSATFSSLALAVVVVGQVSGTPLKGDAVVKASSEV